MLTGLKIGNFKAFSDTQYVPIRPITLIFGPNSSGKSSILHSLVFAHHAQETGVFDVHLTNIGGTAVDLGGFRQFIHGRDSDLRLQLEWTMSSQNLSVRMLELLGGTKKITIGLTIGWSGFGKSVADILGNTTPRELMLVLLEDARKNGDHLEVEKLERQLDTAEDKLTLEEVSRLKSHLRVEKCWIEVDDSMLMSTSVRPDGTLRLDSLNRDHSVVRFLIRNLVLAYSTSDHIDSRDIDSFGETIDQLVSDISFSVVRLFPQKFTTNDEYGASVGGLPLIAVRKESRQDDLKKVIRSHLPSILAEVLIGSCESVTGELKKLTYLGPLRTYPPRHIGFSDNSDPNWVAGGGAAWDMVRRDSVIRQKVNEWLGDEKKLSTHYELKIRYLLTIESIRSKFAELASRAIKKGWDNAEDEDGHHMLDAVYGEIEESIHELPDALEKLESLLSDIQELVLFDKRSRTSVSHRDVGIGISQVLPVLVTCFASRNKMIAMEQPEIHLHPALQAELGDVFIESALGENKNTFLIETHSEHLILRIMRRMRQTSSGELPEGIPAVKPEDVCVLFVEPDGSRSIVREMPLNEQGELVKAWPGGFFEEGLKEIF